jgi:GNAT superfamily N-acetyltransferase
MTKNVARSALRPGDLAVAPVKAVDWPDIATLMAGLGKEHGCWCQYFRLSSGDYSRMTPGMSHEERLRQQVAGEPSPGILARLHGEPVGWCGLWPRARFERLARSRTIPRLDEKPVWSIICFLVRPGSRRRGVAHALLGAAIEYARQAGAPAIEAYPIDSQGERVNSVFAYVGLTSMFEAAGFRRVQETLAHSDRRVRWLMRLDL